MSIDINVHITADNQLVNAISDVARALAAVAIAKTGRTEVALPEKAVSAPTAPAENHKEQGKGKDINAPKSEPHTAKEEKAINDMLSVPAPSDPKPKEEDTTKREKMKALFTKAATEGKQAACKALLKELGVTRQSQIPADKLDEAIAKVEAL